MNWDDSFFAGVDEDELRREKAKARELRQSRWWQNKLGRRALPLLWPNRAQE